MGTNDYVAALGRVLGWVVYVLSCSVLTIPLGSVGVMIPILYVGKPNHREIQ